MKCSTVRWTTLKVAVTRVKQIVILSVVYGFACLVRPPDISMSEDPVSL